ncbi:hypothetical protein SEA_MADMEN_86 [Mycobacterium phage MadMen]|nr:hypothetical protein SEA_MADMEN_86 [Mycobacterium phage MadMen]
MSDVERDLDLDAIRDDIQMAARSPEMARHVALDHGPELVAEVERLRARETLIRELANRHVGAPCGCNAIAHQILAALDTGEEA